VARTAPAFRVAAMNSAAALLRLSADDKLALQ
jgi:hypothetical protein